MSLLVFKRSVFHTQLRQFTILLVCNRSQTRKVIDSSGKIAYPNLSSRNSTACRLFASEHKRDDNSSETLPPLVEISEDSPIPSAMWLYCLLNYGINFTKYDFSFLEFRQGSKAAAHRISHALAMQDYKALEGLVRDETIEVLKRSVDRLTPVQRSKIDMTHTWSYCFVRRLTIENSDDDEESRYVGEVQIFYAPKDIENTYETYMCNYTFERMIRDYDTPWIVTWLNHYGLADYFAFIKRKY